MGGAWGVARIHTYARDWGDVESSGVSVTDVPGRALTPNPSPDFAGEGKRSVVISGGLICTLAATEARDSGGARNGWGRAAAMFAGWAELN